MPSALPLVMTATRAVADAVHAARGAPKPPPASASPVTTAATGGALLAARRALALRLLFDTSAADVLARWYRRRTAPLARTLRRRGFLRLHDLVRDPPARAAAWVSLAALLAYLYHRRHRARWAVEREFAPLRAAIQSRLDDAASYEEFKRAALDMEALEDRVAQRSPPPPPPPARRGRRTAPRAVCGRAGSRRTTASSSRSSFARFARSAHPGTWRR